MNANLMTKKIEMTKTEAKAAGKINSEKFNELHTLRTMYPTFEIVIKASAAKKSTKENYKGLTYEYMEKYIPAHDDEKNGGSFHLSGFGICSPEYTLQNPPQMSSPHRHTYGFFA